MTNPTIELIGDHRSVRSFAPVPVDRTTIAAAVTAAQMASTSSHVQPYSVLNVTDEGVRRRLAVLCGNQRQVVESGAFLVVSADIRRHELLAAREGTSCAQNLESFLVAVVDTSLFAQNLALVFESEGMGICFVGGLRNDLGEVDALLEVPSGVLPLYGLCVGVPKQRPNRKPRLPVEAVLFDDVFPDDPTLLSLIDEYDETMARYYAERGAEGRSWSEGIVQRYCAARRPELATYYAAKGVWLR